MVVQMECRSSLKIHRLGRERERGREREVAVHQSKQAAIEESRRLKVLDRVALGPNAITGGQREQVSYQEARYFANLVVQVCAGDGMDSSPQRCEDPTE